jgi:hypothetical protein
MAIKTCGVRFVESNSVKWWSPKTAGSRLQRRWIVIF